MPHSGNKNYYYPFSAIVGQEAMKLGLIVSVINPRIGGLLIRGEKGTAKSTAVRALTKILPYIEVVADCAYSCEPKDTLNLCDSCRNGATLGTKRKVRMVELPLNATEEMVIGGLDFAASVRKGIRTFQPGLIAKANRGILYIDEVNLFADHIMDSILDVCASGYNLVQREGISYCHPARFTIVGTMNPEEGELRPQLLDRFGLCIEVQGEQDIESRVLVLERKEEFDRDPQAFCKRFELEEQRLSDRISQAISFLPTVVFPNKLQTLVAEICSQNNVAGHRADIIIVHTARALAANHGRDEVSSGDVRLAASWAIPHRARESEITDQDSLDEQAPDTPIIPEIQPRYFDEYPKQQPCRVPQPEIDAQTQEFAPTQRAVERKEQPETIFDIGPTFKVREIAQRRDKLFRQSSGKRSRTRTKRKRGRYVRSTSMRSTNDVAFDATLRAAAPHQTRRCSGEDLFVKIHDEDIREKVRENRTSNFLLFIVDASGSMGAKGRMMASKGAIMSLLEDAYLRRDRVAMVSFRKQQAVVNLPPTSSIYRAGRLLHELPIGGKTPLSAGLRKGQVMLVNHMIKDPTCRPIVIIMTDGKANESMGNGDPFWEALDVAKSLATDKRIKFVVVDAEEMGGFHYGFAERLAEVLNADYFKIRDLRADTLLELVRE